MKLKAIWVNVNDLFIWYLIFWNMKFKWRLLWIKVNNNLLTLIYTISWFISHYYSAIEIEYGGIEKKLRFVHIIIASIKSDNLLENWKSSCLHTKSILPFFLSCDMETIYHMYSRKLHRNLIEIFVKFDFKISKFLF